jgi:hypothetical protein
VVTGSAPHRLYARDTGGEDFRGDPIYRHDIFVTIGDGTGTRLLIREGLRPIWSPDDKALAFLRYTRQAIARSLEVSPYLDW